MHAQRPLGSGFSPASTATDVLAGIDLSGMNAIVTGGHSGIGLETTRALCAAGAHVTVGARDPSRATDAVKGLANVAVEQLDLLDPRSIEAFVESWGRTPLHILINNAAPNGSGQGTHDARGFELHFATSHLGHFQLTLGLHEALRAAKGARVVNVSSGAHRFGEIRWDDPNFQREFDGSRAYAQAKKANLLFAVELDRRWSREGIRGYAVHPGVVVGTRLNSTAGPEALRRMGLIDEDGNPIIDPLVGKKTPAQGASTTVFAATSPLLADIGGVYLVDNDVAVLDDDTRALTANTIPTAATSASLDPEAARRLWTLSENLLA